MKSNGKMRRLAITTTLIALFAVSVTACNQKNNSNDTELPSETGTVSSETDVPVTSEIDDDPATEAELPATDNTEAETGDNADADLDGFSYEDLENMEFWFCAGIGGWATIMTVEADGSFSGTYHDSEMGITGEGYPGGTYYLSEFSGQFSPLEKVNSYTYSTTIKEIHFTYEPDTEEIRDEIKYVYCEPYGLENAEELLFYEKGAPVHELPEEFLSWAHGVSDAKLPFYGLYNVEEEYGFCAVDVSE